MPSKWKIRGLNEKFVLKETLRNLLPESIVTRPKQPFRAPISQSLLSQDIAYIQDMLSDDSLTQSNLLDISKVKLFLNKLRKGKQVSEFNNMALAGILSSQVIHTQFIENFSTTTIAPILPDLIFDKRTHQ